MRGEKNTGKKIKNGIIELGNYAVKISIHLSEPQLDCV